MLEKSKSCVMCGKTAITLYIEFDAWVCSSDCADALYDEQMHDIEFEGTRMRDLQYEHADMSDLW